MLIHQQIQYILSLGKNLQQTNSSYALLNYISNDLKIPPSTETRTKLECHIQLLFRHSVIVVNAVVINGHFP